jgi:hypothetical protein
MSNKDKHVVRHDQGWAVKSGGMVTSIRDTQKAAQRDAIQQAKWDRSDVVIHGRDGKIRAKDSYGNDPYPPKDKK